MNYYIIEELTPVEDARKDICDDGSPYTGKRDQVSEWAVAVGMAKFKIGQSVSEEELQKAIFEAVNQQNLDALVDMGLLTMTWDEKSGEPVYSAKRE